jgi:lysophospholipase L1-like esterase
MFLPPDHPLLQYTDCFAVEVTPTRARFSRPGGDANGFGHVSPGARVRFATDATDVTLRVLYTALMTRADAFADIGAVLVDGRLKQTFRHKGSWDSLSVRDIAITHGARAVRVHDVVLPYGASLDFHGVTLADGDVLPAPARPSVRHVAYGDSLTQGYNAPTIVETWAFAVAAAKNWQLINLGAGSLRTADADAASIAAAKPDVVTVQVGTNDFLRQTALGDFIIGYHALLRDVCATNPKARIYAISPLWSAADRPVAVAVYGAAAADAVRAVGCERLRLIDGATLTDHDLDYFVDGIHPNDKGMAQIAERLAAQMG